MRYEYNNFAFLREESIRAAEATMCAADQDLFWPYHDMLFANQGPHGDGSLKQYAESLGMDSAQFDECLDSGLHSQDVADQKSQGTALGVGSTPTVFVNGIMFKGAHDFGNYKDTIEAELAQAQN